jgi:hypothetical protein
MEYIKDLINEYDEVIYKLVMAVLYMGVGCMIGYLIGVSRMIGLVG